MDSKYQEIGNSSKYDIFANFRSKHSSTSNIKINGVHNQTNSSGSKKAKLNHANSNNCNGFTPSERQQTVWPAKMNKGLQEARKLLPVYNVRNKLVEHIAKNRTTIVLGETGSGKTTQIPQYLWEMGISNGGAIAITQPRRVAAITIAQRVAQEQNCPLGDLVGYSVRFEDVSSKKTRIKYMTDGILLREALLDKLLLKYSILILDEAHERSINTDLLFGIAKKAQEIRSKPPLQPLTLIIMSATVNVQSIEDYFGQDCIPIILTGRSYKVNTMHVKSSQDDYVFTCLVTLFDVHKKAPAGHDVLIFLTGQEEIEAMVQYIRQIAKDNNFNGRPTLRVYPFYSNLPQMKQLELFRPTAPNSRKVIVSTNVAETSLTINGIKYVIDSGKVKTRAHDSMTGLEKMKVTTISKAQAWQRAGRAGRESEGTCYRAYTSKQFEEMPEDPIPEILRANITTTLLQLLAMKIDIDSFDFIDRPSNESIAYGLKQLYMLGAIKDVNCPVLTELGRKMSQFPLDARFSKLLLSAPEFGCVDEILSLVAVMSSESVYNLPQENRDKHLENHRKFESPHGDHLSLLNVYREFQNKGFRKLWCFENSLIARNLLYAKEIRAQLSDICDKCNIPMSSCGTDTDQVRKCLLTGLFGNTAERQRDKKYITLLSRQTAYLHPSSNQLSQQPQFVIYSEIVQTSKTYLRQITPIEPEWLTEVVPNWRSYKSH